MEVKTLEITTKNYVEGTLRALVNGSVTTKQAIGMIRSSGIRGEKLNSIINRVTQYVNNKTPLQIVREECIKENLI